MSTTERESRIPFGQIQRSRWMWHLMEWTKDGRRGANSVARSIDGTEGRFGSPLGEERPWVKEKRTKEGQRLVK